MYYLGLDIGTNSVGWALTNEEHKLIRKGGKRLWGVRMFEESKDASERRLARGSRRRIDRRNERVDIVRELFSSEISKIDPTFYERLDESFYVAEDRKYPDYHNMFNNGLTDKEFYDKYPTIYHLRKDLLVSHTKIDIRYIYLVISNMMKKRGHFLASGDEFNVNDTTVVSKNINEIFAQITDLAEQWSQNDDFCEENYFDLPELTQEWFDKFILIMSQNTTKSAKKAVLKELFQAENKSFVDEALIPLLIGSSVKLNSLKLVKDKKYESCEISINVENLDGLINESEGKVPEFSTVLTMLPLIKDINDYFYLDNLLKGSNGISDAMIKKYDEHKRDLKTLKELIKKYLPNKYYECFKQSNAKKSAKGDKSKSICNYPAYVGLNTNHKTKKLDRFGHCSREDFYKYIRSLLEQIKAVEVQDIISDFNLKMENNNFLLKQNSDQNASLPMQLNKSELRIILNNQKEFYPFLDEKDADGLTVIEKLIKTFEYKRPYYIGPINSHATNAWAVRNSEYENVHITPWNFEKAFNKDESAKAFIERMQNKCTYLKGKDDYCLPKFSIIFSEYNCLSYVNKIRINGELIDKNLKEQLMADVFKKEKQPTAASIKKYLKTKNIELTDALPLCTCTMSSYIKMVSIFGEQYVNKHIEQIENIIKDITIFEDKSILEERLIKLYHLDDNKVKLIKDLNYTKYSSLSKRLINGLATKTGQTLLEVMRETNLNLNEILYSPIYNFKEVVDDYNKEITKAEENMTLEEFMKENIFLSPDMHRPLIQTLNIISELEQIIHHPIDKYFVETERSNKQTKGDKGVTVSRYQRLQDCYKNAKDISIDLRKELDDNKDKLKSDKIYFYFAQLGRSMYTGQKIDFDDLFNDNLWDIDHIYPQSLIKDDSINNRVLVEKTINVQKSDKCLYEINNLLDPNRVGLYKKLLDMQLISKEKFRRLTQKEISKEDINGFINRQNVITNQAVSSLMDILKMYKKVDNKNIIYAKAENVSDFRRDFDLPKSRTANNFHHAHDAYLNIIVGDVLNTYYTDNGVYYFDSYDRMKTEHKTINAQKIMHAPRLFKKKTGEVYWDLSSALKQINHNLYETFDVLETTRMYNDNHLYSKMTILSAGNGMVPRNDKTNNINRYGGITSDSYCKYIVIKNTVIKKKEEHVEYCLIAIPKRYEHKEKEWLKLKGYNNAEIVVNNIMKNVIIEKNNLKYMVTGVSESSFLIKNAYDRFFSKQEILTIKHIDKYLNNLQYKENMIVSEDSVIVSLAKDKNCSEIVLHKDEIIHLIYCISHKYTLPQYKYSVIQDLHNKIEGCNLNEFAITDLIAICSELLLLLKTNERKMADLKLIGASTNSGKLAISQKLIPETKIVAESVTGYYKKVLFEVPC